MFLCKQDNIPFTSSTSHSPGEFEGKGQGEFDSKVWGGGQGESESKVEGKCKSEFEGVIEEFNGECDVEYGGERGDEGVGFTHSHSPITNVQSLICSAHGKFF